MKVAEKTNISADAEGSQGEGRYRYVKNIKQDEREKDMEDKNTAFIEDMVGRAETIEEFKEEIMPVLKSQKDMWLKKINEIWKESGIPKKAFASMCRVSRPTIDSWLNEGVIPRKRESFIRVGMIAGYDVDTMNRFLKRYGRYPELYIKNMEDCICMYVLENYRETSLEKYDYILKSISDVGVVSGDSEKDNVSTAKFESKLSEVHGEDELEKFITENRAVFASAYSKFYSFVKLSIRDKMERYNTKHLVELEDAEGWPSYLRSCVSGINTNKWQPERNVVISIGLYLDMEKDEINYMLELAHMDPLCARNVFESAIIFAVENAVLSRNEDEESWDDESAYLIEIRRSLEKMDVKEITDFVKGLPEDDDYD